MPQPRRVLIVEDEDILAANLKAHLERVACEPRIAADGASAIALAEHFVPDVVVIDYLLPDMSGFEVVDAIRRRIACGCVLITGHPTSDVLEAAGARGIEHILFKPFPLAELSSVVCGPTPDARRPPIGAAGQVQADRRQLTRDGFPMLLFDGSWLYVERRRRDGLERN